jgi:hypothetical protein
VPADLSALPGAPESRLPGELLAQLPGRTPAPPWACRVEATLWWHRASPAARAALPPALAGRALLPYVAAAVVRYLDSPVGPYWEVLGSVLLRPLVASTPFICVDELASVHGGRAHWALPKGRAAFSRTADGELVADGGSWRVGATARPLGPRLPAAGLLRGLQVDGQGRPWSLTATAYGRVRLARVDVQVGTDLAGEPGSIAGWLRSGRHPGAVLHGRLRVGGGPS